jgi:tetratricopeptide (TPR) repeat protein
MRCLLLFFFLPILTFAQPGGGGGLVINHIISKNKIEIRAFLMEGKSIHHELEDIFQNAKITIPSSSDFKENLDIKDVSVVRLLLVQQNKKMIIDLVDIPGDNPMGRTDLMDSLEFMEGHFIHNRGFDKTNSGLQKRGLTKSNLNKLVNAGLVSKSVKIPMNFLEEKNLPASYHNYKADSYLKKNELEKAATELELAKNKCGINCCQTNFLLTDYYNKKGKYDLAIEHLNKAMKCRKSVFYYEEDNYYQRAELLVKAGRTKEALKDYDYIIKTSENPFPAITLKAYSRTDQLDEGQKAIAELEKILAEVPAEHFNEKMLAWSEYCEIFYALGNVYYKSGNKEKAADNWYKAMLLAYSNNSSNAVVLQMDTVISENPKLTKAYMVRAIAKYRRGPYLGWGDETKNVFRSGLEDIKKAKELGLNTYEVYIYSALILKELKEKNEALEQIELAIALNSADARGYIWRYHIRQDLGKAAWGNKNDPDILMFEKLKKDWIFDPK